MSIYQREQIKTAIYTVAAAVIISLFILLLARTGCVTQKTTESKQKTLFDAIRMIESSDGQNLVSFDGKCLGPYQISRAYWKDACEYGESNLSYDEYVFSQGHCEQIMLWFWARYGAETDQERAILHCCGPKPLLYWRKIQHNMKGK